MRPANPPLRVYEDAASFSRHLRCQSLNCHLRCIVWVLAGREKIDRHLSQNYWYNRLAIACSRATALFTVSKQALSDNGAVADATGGLIHSAAC